MILVRQRCEKTQEILTQNRMDTQHAFFALLFGTLAHYIFIALWFASSGNLLYNLRTFIEHG